MRVLVTGGAGFIGSHICRALLKAGHYVTVVDDLSSVPSMSPPEVDFQQLDINQLQTYHLHGIQAVVHAAAKADISRNWESPVERSLLMRDNVDGTFRLLEAMPRVPMVFLSTGAVYGAGSTDEGAPTVATSPYAASKIAGEALVQAYAFHRGTPAVILRLASVVGSGYHHGHIADFVQAGRGVECIHARSIPGMGKSHIHVSDVAGACVAAVRGEVPGGIYNMSGGLWSWDLTAKMMRLEYTHAGWSAGWDGDVKPVMGQTKLERYYVNGHSVSNGVRESLEGLGWRR